MTDLHIQYFKDPTYCIKVECISIKILTTFENLNTDILAHLFV